jgi:hypothetical protein
LIEQYHIAEINRYIPMITKILPAKMREGMEASPFSGEKLEALIADPKKLHLKIRDIYDHLGQLLDADRAAGYQFDIDPTKERKDNVPWSNQIGQEHAHGYPDAPVSEKVSKVESTLDRLEAEIQGGMVDERAYREGSLSWME